MGLSFVKKVRKSGSGTLEITIPKDVRDPMGLVDGDYVAVDIKRIKEIKSEKKENKN